MFNVIKIIVFLTFCLIFSLFTKEVIAADIPTGPGTTRKMERCELVTVPSPLVTYPGGDRIGQGREILFIIQVGLPGTYDVILRRGIVGGLGPYLWEIKNLTPNASGDLAFRITTDGTNLWEAGKPHLFEVIRQGAPGNFCPGISFQVFKIEEVQQVECNILGPKEANENTEIKLSGTISPAGTYKFFLSAERMSSPFTPDASGSIPEQNLGILNRGQYQIKLQKNIPKYDPSDEGFGSFVDDFKDVLSCRINPITVSTVSEKPTPDTTPTKIGTGETAGPLPVIIPEGCTIGTPGCTSAEGKQCGSKKDPAIQTAIGCIHTSPTGFVKDFLEFLVAISGGLAFLLMLLGAFQILTSAGNPETLQAGRERFTNAIIGLLFVIFAVLLLQIIGVDILKLPGLGR